MSVCVYADDCAAARQRAERAEAECDALRQKCSALTLGMHELQKNRDAFRLENDALIAARDRSRALRKGFDPGRHCGCEFDENQNVVVRCSAHQEMFDERDALREALKNLRDLVWGGADSTRLANGVRQANEALTNDQT